MAEIWQHFTYSIVSDWGVFRLLMVAFAIAFSLTPPKKQWREMLLFAARLALVLATLCLTGFLFSAAIVVWALPMYLDILNDFIRAGLVTVLYAAAVCRYPQKSKWVTASSQAAFLCTGINLCYAAGHILADEVEWRSHLLLVIIYGSIVGFAFLQQRLSVAQFHDFPVFGMILTIVTSIGIWLTTLFTQILDTVVLLPGVYSVLVYVVLLVMVFITYTSMYYVCMERNDLYKMKMENQLIRAGYAQMEISKASLA